MGEKVKRSTNLQSEAIGKLVETDPAVGKEQLKQVLNTFSRRVTSVVEDTGEVTMSELSSALCECVTEVAGDVPTAFAAQAAAMTASAAAPARAPSAIAHLRRVDVYLDPHVWATFR